MIRIEKEIAERLNKPGAIIKLMGQNALLSKLFMELSVDDFPPIETFEELATPYFKGAPAKFEIVE